MVRSKHGGWRVHESKPPTMPDNPSYPKKVLIGQCCIMCTCSLQDPRWEKAFDDHNDLGFKVSNSIQESESQLFPGWRSRSDAQYHLEPSCDSWAACQGISQLIDLWKGPEESKIVSSRLIDLNISERGQDGGWGGAGARSAPSPLWR